MQFFLSFMLVISFATFQLAFGDDNKVDSLADDSNQNQEVAELETLENDDEEDDDAEYRWLAPEIYDEIQKRAVNQSAAVAAGQEEGQEQLKKNKKKGGGGNKNKNKNKNNKKNKPAKKKFKNKGMSPM